MIGADFGVVFCVFVDTAATEVFVVDGLVIGCVVVVTKTLSAGVEATVLGVVDGTTFVVELTHSRFFSRL